MLSLIFDQVSFAHAGGDEILTDVTFSAHAGFTALVGDNGAGKTTLLELAAGLRAPARGAIRRNLTTIAVAAQRVDAPDDAIAQLAWTFDRDALRIRARFGLGDDDLARWETLSPGERKRWQLAAALFARPDLLVVDEPSNHLDAAALGLAADALAAFEGVGLIVSHDRALLDRLATQTVRVHAGSAHAWPGNYSAARAAWEAEADSARAQRTHLAAQRRRAERQLADARRKEHAATRGVATSARMRDANDSDARTLGAKTRAEWAAAGAGRQVGRAHTRVDATRSAELAISVERERGAPIAFADAISARRWVVQLDLPELRAGETAASPPADRQLDVVAGALELDASDRPHVALTEFSAPVEGRVLARDIRLALARDERAWVRGANGAGKTTLLAAVLARCSLAPEHVFALPQDLSAEAGAALAGEIRGLDRATRGRLGQLLDALGADPDAATRSVAPSPGETRKLALALGLVRAPQLLVLDEPTNHLDLDSIERLEAALAEYPGALLLVTHDSRFAEALCGTTWTIEGERVIAAPRG